MDYWAAKLIDDLHPYRTIKDIHAPGLGQRIGYGVNSQDAVGIAQAYQASRIADALVRIGDLLTQGIDARSGQTEGLDPKGESPVAESDAPNTPSTPSIKGGA